MLQAKLLTRNIQHRKHWRSKSRRLQTREKYIRQTLRLVMGYHK